MAHITYRNVNIPYLSNEAFYKEVEAGKWESYTFDAIDRFGQDSSMLFDVGAWLGIFSYYYTVRYNKPAMCFECDPQSIELLKNEVASWEADSVKVHMNPFGLGGYCGKARLNTQSCFGNSESSMQTRSDTSSYHLVDVMTFDVLTEVGQNCSDSLVKVDIEGSEFDFLKGGSCSLLHTKVAKAIAIAFHPAWTPDMQSGIDFVIDNYFDVYNVECSVQPHVNISPEHFRAMLTNDIAHSFVFVRKDR